MKEIGDRISEIQQDQELNNTELGKALGISKAAIGAWKKGTSRPSAENLIKLRQLYGYNEAWVLTGKSPKKIKPAQDEFVYRLSEIVKNSSYQVKEDVLEYALFRAQRNGEHKQ